MKNVKPLFSFLMVLMAVPAMATSGPALTYQGRILKADGTPVVSASVQFKVQVRTSGAENCLLWEETATKDLSASGGSFAIGINDGTGTRTDGGTYTMNQILSNRAAFTFATGLCSTGTTYTPNANDGRSILVYFNDGSFTGWEAIPQQAVNLVPQAVEALQVGGFTTDSLLRVANVAGPQTATALTPANFTELLALINGTSLQYLKNSGTTGTQLPVLTAAPTGSNLVTGSMWYDSATQSIEYYDGTSVTTLGAGGGSGSLSSANAYVTLATVAGAQTLTANVGTAANTLAAGNDTRIVNAVQTKTVATLTGVILNDTATTPKTVSIQAPTTVTTSYVLRLPPAVATAAGQVLTSDTSGNLTWTTPAVTGVTGVLPVANGGTNSSTALSNNRIMVSSGGAITEAAALTNGQLLVGSTGAAPAAATLTAGTGVTITNTAGAITIGTSGLQASTLADGNIWVGQTTTPTAVAPSGDISMTNAGVFSVTGVKGKSITAAPTTAGQMLRYNGTSWAPNFVSMGDLRSNVTGNTSLASSCGTNQTLTYNSAMDNLTCASIAISDSQITYGSQSANTIFAGPTTGTGAPTFRALASSDIPAGVATQWTTTGSDIYYTTGKVGIGTATPAAVLSVLGGVASAGGDLSTITQATADAASSPRSALTIQSMGTGGSKEYNVMGKNSGGSVTFSVTQGGFLSSTGAALNGGVLTQTGAGNNSFAGNLGIGTATPSTALHVIGSGTISGGLAVGGTITSTYLNANTYIWSPTYYGSVSASGNLTLDSTFSATKGNIFIAPSGGNVGIGTNVPGSTLDVNGTYTMRGIASPSVSAAGQGRIYFDSTANAFMVSQNGAAYTALAASGTSAGSNTSPSMTFSGDTDTGFYDASSNNTISVTSGGDKIFDFSSSGIVSPTSGGANITTDAGTAAAPTYSFAGDTGTGWWNPAASTMAASTGGVERVRIDSTGRVGIGTTSPTASLHIIAPSPASGNGIDGIVAVASPATVAAGSGGGFTFTGGDALTTGFGGGFTFTGGASPTGSGGSVSLTAGTASGGSGGGVVLQAGGGNGATGGLIQISTSNYNSGAILIKPGKGGSAATTGALNLTGGDGGSSKPGGVINITGGIGGTSTNTLGGDVVINGGAKNGTGTDGNVLLAGSRGAVGIGTNAPGSTLDVNGTYTMRGIAAPAVSAASQGRIYFDSTANAFMVSQNGGAYTSLVSTGGAGGGLSSTSALTFNSNSDNSGSDGGFGFQSNGSSLLTIANNGDTAISSTTASAGSTTGALVVGGGIGVGGTINAVQSIKSSTGLSASGSSTTAYATSSSSTATPTGAIKPYISVQNGSSTDTTAAYHLWTVANTATNLQSAYMAAVSTTGAGVYSPAIVIGQQTGATAYSERMRIDSNGNVGIGTTTATNPLTLAAGSATNPALSFGDSGTGFYWQSANVVSFAAAGTRWWDFNSYLGASTAHGPAFFSNTSVTTTTPTILPDRSVTNTGFAAGTSGNINAIVGGAEVMRLTGSGVGIGTNVPGSTLDVNGTYTMRGIAAPAVSATGQGRMYFDSTANTFMVSQNGGAYTALGSGGSGSAAGSNTSPSMTFSGDTDTGFYDTSSNNTISVASGGAKIFDLSSSGIVSPTSGGANITTAAGTAAAPTYSFAGDTGTGWWNPAASTMAASTGGTERMRIDSTGKVGIGTTSPATLLDVEGTSQFGGAVTITTGNLKLSSGNLGVAGANTTSNAITLSGSAARTIGMETASSAAGFALSIVAGGAKTSGTDLAGGSLILASGSSQGVGVADIQFQTPTAGTTGATTNAVSTKMIITGAGYVGIGTTVPATSLDVSASGAAVKVGSGAATSSSIDFSASRSFVGFQSGTTSYGYLKSYSNIGLFSNNSGTPQFMMDVSGNVGIGTTIPTSLLNTNDTSAKTAAYTGVLHSVTNTSATASVNKIGMDIESTGAWTGTSAVNTGLVVNATGGTTNYAATFSGGSVGIGTATPTAGSVLDVYGTTTSSSMMLPRDTTTNRPATGVAGMFRFNTTTGNVEWYSGSGWVAPVTNGSPTFSGTVSISTTNASTYLASDTNYAPFQTTLGNLNIANSSGADLKGLALTMKGSNTSGIAQMASIATVFTSGASSYSPSLVFGQSTTSTGGYTERMRLDPSGNLGIGTSAPGSTLDVNGIYTMRGIASASVSASGQGRIYFDSSANTFMVSQNGGAYTALAASGTSAGSNTSPSMTFSGDTDTGFYDTSSNNVISVATGGTKIFDLSSSGIVSPTTGGANITTAAGAAAAPTYSFAGDTTSGLFRPAASTVSIAAGGVEAARFLTTASAVNYLTLTPAVTTAAPILAVDGSDTNIDMYLNPKGTGALRSSAQKMFIENSSSCISFGAGTGTTSCGYTVAVAGVSGAGSVGSGRASSGSVSGYGLTVQAGAAKTSATDKNGGDLTLAGGISTGVGSSNIQFSTATAAGSTGTADNAPTTKMTLTGAGHLGIGTTGPTGLLEVAGSSANALAVGPTGATNPTLQVDSSTTSAATGLSIKSAAAAGGVALQVLSSGTNEALSISSKGTGNLTLATPGLGSILFSYNGGLKHTLSATGAQFNSTANAAATTIRFGFTGAADTLLTSATEAPDVYFNLGQVRQHATASTIATQRDFRITPSTHTFQSAGGIITDNAALAIDGPPTGGTNSTLTNSSAILVQTSALTNVTNGYGLNIAATTGATNNYAAVFTGGNVGIGTASPSAKLTVAGPIVSVPVAAAAAAVDLSASDTTTLASVGGSAIALSNMVHGGTYTLVVQDTTSRTYTFTGCNSTKYKPANTATTAGTVSIYTILTVYNGSTYDCYISWASGYQ